tara:strand:+ start:3338 stop:3667 length:330 start_codon:yes stop_codon:yes gene_type:complete
MSDTNKDLLDYNRDYNKVKEIVREYLDINGWNYIPNFGEFNSEQYSHVLSIGTEIMLNHWGMNKYDSGGFISSFINNDLEGTYAQADSINQECVRFYLMLKHNVSLVLV